MFALVAALPLLIQGQPARLRTVLPNHAAVLVEPMPSPTISLQLWSASKGVDERLETHGLRHLMEHILALGPARDVDRRLETEGGSLVARTYRDATQLEITVPSGKLSLALAVLSDLLKPLQVTHEQVQAENKIIEQEFAILDDDALLTKAAWYAAYGISALDPMGDPDVMKTATPRDLEAVRAHQFVAPNIAVVVVGPVGLDEATRDVVNLLSQLPKAPEASYRSRVEGLPGSAEAAAFGEARAAIVPSFASVETVSALAAALAVGSKLDDCYVTYTPSIRRGLVVLGRTEKKTGLGEYLDQLDQAGAAGLFDRGKILARGWVERLLHSPSGVGFLRGLLMCQGIGNRPEMMIDSIQSMRFSDFQKALNSFQRQHSVSVAGNR